MHRYYSSQWGRFLSPDPYMANREDHLKLQQVLRPGSIRSYRDTIKLLLVDVAAMCSRPVTRLTLNDLTFERVLDFLRTDGNLGLRDRPILMFLYNAGARVQEAADLRNGTSTSMSPIGFACTAKETSGAVVPCGRAPWRC